MYVHQCLDNGVVFVWIGNIQNTTLLLLTCIVHIIQIKYLKNGCKENINNILNDSI